MLVLGRLIILRQNGMPLDAADDGDILQITLKIRVAAEQPQLLDQRRGLLRCLISRCLLVLFFFLAHILLLFS